MPPSQTRSLTAKLTGAGKMPLFLLKEQKEVQYLSDECTFEGAEDSGTIFDRIIHIRIS